MQTYPTHIYINTWKIGRTIDDCLAYCWEIRRSRTDGWSVLLWWRIAAAEHHRHGRWGRSWLLRDDARSRVHCRLSCRSELGQRVEQRESVCPESIYPDRFFPAKVYLDVEKHLTWRMFHQITHRRERLMKCMRAF